MTDPDTEYLISSDIVSMPIDMLIPNPQNARIHDERDLQVLMNLIKRFKFRKSNAVQIDEEGNIICGHGRVEAAKRLGMTQVPVDVLEGYTPEELRMKALSDNMSQDLSLFDYDIVNSELDGLKEWFNVEDFGFTLPDLPDLEHEEEPEVISGENDPKEESFNTLVLLDNQEDFDHLQAFLVENGFESKRV